MEAWRDTDKSKLEQVTSWGKMFALQAIAALIILSLIGIVLKILSSWL